jgi:PAS domain S-box-containing protein
MNYQDTADTTSLNRRLKRWFVDPLHNDLNAVARRRAQSLAAICLSIVGLGLPVLLITYLIEEPADDVVLSAAGTLTIIMVGLALMYPLTRTRHYLIAAWGIVLVFTVPYYLLALPHVNGLGPHVFIYLVIPLIICSIIFGVRTMVLVAAIHLLLIASMPLLYPSDIQLIDILPGPLSVVGASAVLLIIASRLAQRTRESEQEQQAMAEALSDIAIALNSSLELNEVMERMLTHLSRVLPYDAATIMVVEDGAARVIRHVGFLARGISEQQLLDVRFPINEIANLRYMVETGQPVLIPDVSKDPTWITIEDMTSWIHGYVGAPIMIEGEMLGVLNVDSATPGTFNENHARRLVSFAAQAAVALRNARLKTELDELVSLRSQQLEREQRRLQAVLDASGEGVIYTEGTTIQYANQALYRMTGYDVGELRGRSARMLLDPESLSSGNVEHWVEVLQGIRAGQVWRDDITLHRKDGSSFDAGMTVSVVDRGSTDDDWGIVAIVRDISQEKALNDKKSRFIANASHELRSPIASLNTRLYMIQRDRDNLDKHLQVLGRIIDRMNRLVEDLLDLSRFENGVIQLHHRSVVLQNLIHEVVETQRPEAETKSIVLDCQLPPAPVQVHVDPERITQVITNLVRNAVIYTQPGGKIEIHTDLDLDGNGRVRGVRVWVRDNGPGIAADDLPHIFQPFYRAEDRSHGTGLGLSIAREIVQLHEGTLTVTSEVGQGSVFCILLPLLPLAS